ncbi:Alpha-humulene 10-hydroxylase [Canna indica]|uniref:Alpha-humulene 10-hydroxylase n=1 Tax=Canna indica TaxID=4628 RepID=A0AAQ3KBP6_9LILI|nr:Alpha-humulene 10-hydroxylase [Canna indica]
MIICLPGDGDDNDLLTMDVFTGGTETSSTVVEWVMSELMRNPKVMEKAQNEVREAMKGNMRVEESEICKLNYLNSIVKETLRLHPPAPLLIPRTCKETCQVLGYTIPAGTRVLTNVWAMGRNPQYWEDAEIFKPERFDNHAIDYKGQHFEFIPFGAGRRMCPGITFGMVNAELVLTNLLYYFDWKLPHGMKPQDLDMTEAFGISAHKKSKLCLLATPRYPLPHV